MILRALHDCIHYRRPFLWGTGGHEQSVFDKAIRHFSAEARCHDFRHRCLSSYRLIAVIMRMGIPYSIMRRSKHSISRCVKASGVLEIVADGSIPLMFSRTHRPYNYYFYIEPERHMGNSRRETCIVTISITTAHPFVRPAYFAVSGRNRLFSNVHPVIKSCRSLLMDITHSLTAYINRTNIIRTV
jgi:hypothetical protein